MRSKTKPILFSTPMVQAILSGNKTQTRREIKFPKSIEFPAEIDFTRMQDGYSDGTRAVFGYMDEPNSFFIKQKCQIGDILWVRETWQTSYNEKTGHWDFIYPTDGRVWIDDEGMLKWKPSIHMPKKAARIFLKVLNVRVEQLQNISQKDAEAEGILKYHDQPYCFVDYNKIKSDGFVRTPYASFATLWESINGEENWKNNPFVWVIEFERIPEPKGFLLL